LNHGDDENDDGDDDEGDNGMDEIDKGRVPTAARVLSTKDTLGEFQIDEIEEYYANSDKYRGGNV
jgi:hypothetical protein